MAIETGTANGHIDLLNKLLAFLSTNPDLVADEQNWQVLRDQEYPFQGTWPGRVAFSNTTSFATVVPDAMPADVPATNVKWKAVGKLNVPTSGSYGFSLKTGTTGGLMIKIDGVVIGGTYNGASLINSNTFSLTFTANLTAGVHDIEIMYVNGTNSSGTYGASLAWRLPGASTFALMSGALFSDMVVRYGYAAFSESTQQGLEALDIDREVVVKGPGLSGQDEVFFGFRTVSNYQADYYNLIGRFMTGYNDQLFYSDQPGVSTAVQATLWNQPIQYWFVANGRRFIVIAKVSTVYASMYGGFILPYALPSEMPYPIVAGGNAASNVRWSVQTASNSSFWNPSTNGSNNPTLVGRAVDGTMEGFCNFNEGSGIQAYIRGKTYPYAYDETQGGSPGSQLNYRPSPDNQYALQPVVLNSARGPDVYGELEGVYHVSGFNNASENTIVIEDDTYLIVQAAFRTTPSDYAAIRLS